MNIHQIFTTILKFLVAYYAIVAISIILLRRRKRMKAKNRCLSTNIVNHRFEPTKKPLCANKNKDGLEE